MNTAILKVLKEKEIILPNAEPMVRGQYDLRGGVPIIDILRYPRGAQYDFMFYDNVTSPNGITLIQGKGTQFAVSVRDGRLQVEDRRKTEEDLPFGVIGIYPHDYYMSNRQFINDLESMCK